MGEREFIRNVYVEVSGEHRLQNITFSPKTV